MTSFPRLPRLLLTNDDGFDAPGLKILAEVAQSFADEIWIIAPEHDQSGTGQSLSIHHPLRCWQRGDPLAGQDLASRAPKYQQEQPRGETACQNLSCENHKFWAVAGTPADCVGIALSHFMAGKKPSLILSGINAGSNVGDEVNLSGTLGAAFTGLMLGVPSIAISQDCVLRKDAKWETARAIAHKMLDHFLARGWRKDTCLSINIPDLPPEKIAGYSWARQAQKNIGAISVDEREDHRQQRYYWLGFVDKDPAAKDNSDYAILKRGEVSVTALGLDRSLDVAEPSVLFDEAAADAEE